MKIKIRLGWAYNYDISDMEVLKTFTYYGSEFAITKAKSSLDGFSCVDIETGARVEYGRTISEAERKSKKIIREKGKQEFLKAKAKRIKQFGILNTQSNKDKKC
jgi:hypothetical protein